MLLEKTIQENRGLTFLFLLGNTLWKVTFLLTVKTPSGKDSPDQFQKNEVRKGNYDGGEEEEKRRRRSGRHLAAGKSAEGLW